MSSVTRTYFTLSVTDMARAVAFYREVLGPVIRHESDTWTELKFGDATVALHATDRAEPRSTGLGVDVVDLLAAYHAVLRAGGQVRHGPVPESPGQLSYEVADTEGNTFTISGAGTMPPAGSPAATAGADPSADSDQPDSLAPRGEAG
jgi:predicted enzyme related to lactoylglutathione lyase